MIIINSLIETIIVIILIVVFFLINCIIIFLPVSSKKLKLTKSNNKFKFIAYPFSFSLLLSALYIGNIKLHIVTMGVLSISFADSISVILGEIYGGKKIPLPTGNKTYFGSFTMVLISFILNFSILSFMSISNLDVIFFSSILISIVVTITDIITPSGFDLISVPLLCVLLAGGLV